MEWDIFQLTVFNLLCFLECLNYNRVKPSLMANYLSAIRANFNIFGLDVAIFQDMRIKYYQRAVQLSAPMNVKLKKIIDIPLLLKVVEQCNLMYMGQVFKPLYLLAFFSFHSFRRSGATFAFNNDVTLQNIQRHGTWTSDCVWRYITDSVHCGEQVADMFRNKLSSI